MDLNKLKIFHAVAKFGGIKLAASELKMRSSSISTSISTLESTLKYKLFTRHHRGMRLTSEGEKLFDLSHKVFNDIEKYFHLYADDCDTQAHEKITISTSQGVASSSWFNNGIASILEDYSNIRIKIIDYRESDFDEISADIFICPYIYDRLDLIQEKICECEFQLAASRSYIRAFGTPKTFLDLDNHRLIAFSKELKNPFSDVDALLHYGRELHNPRDIFLEVNSSVGLLRTISNGLGIASILKEDIKYYDFVPLFDVDSNVIKSIYATYHKKHSNLSIIKSLCASFKSYENSAN